MSENALLYQLLVNKQKLKPLNIKQDEYQQKLKFHLDDDTNDDVIDENNILYRTNQIFNKYCRSSTAINNNIKLFNEFLEAEMSILINKFEKYSIGKTE